jgi:hypothetical protein
VGVLGIKWLKRLWRSRCARDLAVLVGGMVALGLLTVSPAGARQTHIFEEVFGSAEQPTFSRPASVTVDQSTGDVLVIEGGANQISRYHADGTPSNFSALSTNVIDGVGPGADQTPENGLGFSEEPNYGQVAIDNSGTATDGNVYVTQNGEGSSVHLIDVFDSSGEYLGQITGTEDIDFGSGPLLEGILSPCGVAADAAGNVYVGGWREEKIYKYDPGGAVPGNSDHVATFETPSPCQLAAGAGPSAGALFVRSYNSGEVRKLNSTTGALSYVVFPVEGDTLANEQAIQLAVNPSDGHLFVATFGSESRGTFEFDATGASGAERVSAIFGGERLVAVDKSTGEVYQRGTAGHLDVYGPLVPLPDPVTEAASDIGQTGATLNGEIVANGEELTECVFEYGLTTAYGETAPCAESFAEIGTGKAKVHAEISGLQEEDVYHYRLVVANANGSADPQGEDMTFQTISRPELLGEWASNVTFDDASLNAKINPQSAETTYRFEWGLEPGPPYESSTADVSIGSAPVPQIVSFFLEGLAPSTAYHFRVVAENECRPETEPGMICVSEGVDRVFKTYSPSGVEPDACPNAGLRGGASARLPDCRAYELVSPVDKNGGDIIRELSGSFDPGAYVQASIDGNAVAYAALYSSFAGEANSFKFNEYLAERTTSGWSSEGIHPPVEGEEVSGIILGAAREFAAFTPDLCSAWLADFQTPAISPDGQDGYVNLYRRDNCGPGKGGLEALTSTAPPVGTVEEYVNTGSVHGSSSGGLHAFFTAKAKLTSDANEGNNVQLYDRFEGANHVVSVLPGGAASPDPFTGVGGGNDFNRASAISADGSRVYWSSGLSNASGGEGKLFVRLHPEQGVVPGECTENATIACTLSVSATNSAFFWAASPDGSAALYSEGETLFKFNLQSGTSQPVASNVIGVVGESEGLSRIYFVSRAALPGSGENSEGDEAVAGKPNLYLGEEGSFSFIGTVAEEDVGKAEPGTGLAPYNVASRNPYFHASRVDPDGSRIVFNARASLTGYDNTDPASDKPAVEVFTYEAGGELFCTSCNPTGSRPGDVQELGMPYSALSERPNADPPFDPAAAWIPTWEQRLHASNVLSEQGDRFFFNSHDALVPRDTNAAMDVYEWEAPGAGSCQQGDPGYFADNGGCLYLISTGSDAEESEFWEASPDGEDVFFSTASKLVESDPGSIDLYDARVNGGFPVREPPVECEGEACQSPPPPPRFDSPSSGTYRGPGNPPHAHRARRCGKGKRKVRRDGKVRCVKKKRSGKQRRRASDERRAGR